MTRPDDTIRTIPPGDSYPGMVDITRDGRSVAAVDPYDDVIAALIAKLGEVE